VPFKVGEARAGIAGKDTSGRPPEEGFYEALLFSLSANGTYRSLLQEEDVSGIEKKYAEQE